MKNSTIIILLQAMNDALKPLAGKRVDDFHQFHVDVRSALNPVLDAYGLNYLTWDIHWSDDERRFVDSQWRMFQINLDFTDDRRIKSGGNRKGRINSVRVVALHKYDESMTLEQYDNNITVEKLNAAVLKQHIHIAELQKGIENAKQYLEFLNGERDKAINKQIQLT